MEKYIPPAFNRHEQVVLRTLLQLGPTRLAQSLVSDYLSGVRSVVREVIDVLGDYVDYNNVSEEAKQLISQIDGRAAGILRSRGGGTYRVGNGRDVGLD